MLRCYVDAVLTSHLDSLVVSGVDNRLLSVGGDEAAEGEGGVADVVDGHRRA